MENKNKEQVFDDYIEMIKKSWTFGKMTDEEKANCIELFENINKREDITGTYIQRWKSLNAVYSGYLCGLGYKGGNWRD